MWQSQEQNPGSEVTLLSSISIVPTLYALSAHPAPVPSLQLATCCNCRFVSLVLVDFEGQAELWFGENSDGWPLPEMGKL